MTLKVVADTFLCGLGNWSRVLDWRLTMSFPWWLTVRQRVSNTRWMKTHKPTTWANGGVFYDRAYADENKFYGEDSVLKLIVLSLAACSPRVDPETDWTGSAALAAGYQTTSGLRLCCLPLASLAQDQDGCGSASWWWALKTRPGISVLSPARY